MPPLGRCSRRRCAAEPAWLLVALLGAALGSSLHGSPASGQEVGSGSAGSSSGSSTGGASAAAAGGASAATPASDAGGTPVANGSLLGGSAPAVRVGGLGLVSDLPFLPAGGGGRAYTVTPSLGIQVLATDNVNQVSSPRRADLVTQISPGLVATADTARLSGSLVYSPTVQLYANSSNQNRIDHTGVGQATVTLVPGQLFLDVRGATAIQSASGGFRPEGTAVVDRRDQVQTSSIQVSPYYIQRFDGWATLRLGYSFQYTQQDGDTTRLLGAGQPYFVSQDLIAHQGQAILTSGENLGRVGFVAQATGTTYSGPGVLDGAYAAQTSVEGRYAFLRGVVGTAEVGYEDQEYRGTPRIRISGPIWSVGVRLTPSAGGLVVAKYGRRNGFESFFLDSAFDIGPRTQVGATFTDTLGTTAQEQQGLLAGSSIGTTGTLVSSTTGAPVLYGDSLLALQNGLFRTRRLSASVSHTWPRDVVTLSVSYQNRTAVAAAAGTQSFSQEGVSGSVNWQHALAPVTTMFVGVQYGTYTSPVQGGTGDVTTFNAGLFTQLTETVTGSVQYVLTNQGAVLSGNRTVQPGAGSLQNVVIAGLRKSF